MELSALQEKLARALSNVGRVASSKSELPILNNVLLRTDGTRLQVASTNLNVAETWYVGANVASPGAITVPARLISEFVSSLPKGQIELKVSGDLLHIRSGNYTSTINGISADDFPELPTIDEESSIQYQLNVSDFKQAVTQTVVTSSSDATRPVLTGTFWHSHDGFVYLAATDGYRLAERRLVETKSDVAVIIPTSTLQEVLRMLGDDEETIDVLFDDTQVRFRVGNAEVTSRLIDGKYPDYRQLIPETSETNITIEMSEFVRITKIARLFARDSGGSVTLTVVKELNQLSVHSIASEMGENTSVADVTTDTDGTVTLNSRYISDALSVLDGSSVNIRFSGKLSPVVLSTESSSNYKHIIMPLKS